MGRDEHEINIHDTRRVRAVLGAVVAPIVSFWRRCHGLLEKRQSAR